MMLHTSFVFYVILFVSIRDVFMTLSFSVPPPAGSFVGIWFAF